MSWFDLARIRSISIHQLPGADEERPALLSTSLSQEPEESGAVAFKAYLLKDLPAQAWYAPNLDQEAEPAILEHLNAMLEEPDALHQEAQKLAHLLAQAANSHRAKSGWLVVVFFDQLAEGLPGIGLFKAETEQWFWEPEFRDETWQWIAKKGLPLNKLDKAAAFIPSEASPGGWKALVADRHAEIRYWLEGFLGLNPISNPAQATKKVMELIKGFSEDVLSVDNQHPREAQLDFLQRSSDFLNQRNDFELTAFSDEVLQSEQLTQDFEAYRESYADTKGLSIPDRLTLAPEAVQKEHGKFMRAVIKLDKNFHVYVHGNRNLMERGFDEESGKYYYKLFFSEEH